MFRYLRTWGWRVFPVSAVLAAVIYAVNVAALPDPKTADRDGLLRWLVLVELADRDRDTQVALLNRLQTEFSDEGTSLNADDADLSETYQARLERNLKHLQELWFFTRCEEVDQLNDSRRAEFLDGQISFAERWGDLAPSAEGPDVFDMIDDWIASVEGERKRVAQDGVRWALHRFLQTRQLAEYPVSMQLELANRIVEDLEDGSALDGFVAEEPREKDLLEPNGMLLIQVWLTDQAQQYAKLDTAAREAYMQKRLQQIEDWNLVSMFAKAEDGNHLKAYMQFSQTTKRWIEEADENQRPAMELLFRDIAQQMTKRLLFGS